MVSSSIRWVDRIFEACYTTDMMNAHTKLARLKEQYEALIRNPPKPGFATRLRRIRDQIIKLEFELGIK